MIYVHQIHQQVFKENEFVSFIDPRCHVSFSMLNISPSSVMVLAQGTLRESKLDHIKIESVRKNQ